LYIGSFINFNGLNDDDFLSNILRFNLFWFITRVVFEFRLFKYNSFIFLPLSYILTHYKKCVVFFNLHTLFYTLRYSLISLSNNTTTFKNNLIDIGFDLS